MNSNEQTFIVVGAPKPGKSSMLALIAKHNAENPDQKPLKLVEPSGRKNTWDPTLQIIDPLEVLSDYFPY